MVDYQNTLRPWQPWGEKAQTSPEKFLQSSISILEGAGSKQQSAQPFNYEAAAKRFTGWVYAAAILNASAVASTPLRLYVRKRKARKLWKTQAVPAHRRKYLLGHTRQCPAAAVVHKLATFGDDFEEVVDRHPLLELLRNANDFLNGYDLTFLRILYGELTGNAYMHPIIGPAGIPAELWLMPAQWVTIVPDKAEFIAGYVYGKNSQVERVFEPDEVIHFKRPNPRSLYYGLGRIEAGWPVILQNESMHVMDQALLDNRARPDYAVIVKSGASQGQIDAFEAKWDARFRQLTKSGRPAVITGDVEIVPLGWPPKDLQGREDIVEEIAAVMQVPVSLLKANDPNLASAQAGFAAWKENTILPLCRMDEEQLNQSLLPMFDIEDDACLAYDNPVPRDEVQDRDTNVAYVANAIMTPNEVRAKEGLPPVEGGDLLAVSGRPFGDTTLPGFSLLSSTASPKRNKSSKSRNPQVPVNQSAMLQGLVHCHCHETGAVRTAVGKFLRECQTKAPREDEPERPLQAMRRRLREIFGDQAERIAQQLELGNRSVEELRRLILADAEAIRQAVQRQMELALIAGGTSALDAIDQPMDIFNVQNPAVVEFVQNYTVRLAGQISETTIDEIEAIVERGIAEGLSDREMARQIRESTGFSAYRAEMIARTESARAFVEGEKEGWRESGIVQGVKWFLAPGACEFCEAMAQQFNNRPIGLDEVFFRRGEVLTAASGRQMKLDYSDIGGPPLHPFDRCDLKPVLIQES